MLTLPVGRGARLRAAAAKAARSLLGPAYGPVSGVFRGLRLVWIVTRSTLAKAWNDRILGLSAESAFWQLLSVPSLMIAVLGLLGYAGQWTGTDLIDRVEAHALRLTSRLVTAQVQHEVVEPIVTELLRHGRGGVALISIVAALWAGSSATATFVNTVSIAYGQRELRGAVASRLLALWIYLCTLVIAVVAAPLLILGPDFLVAQLPDGWHAMAEAAVRLAYWPLTAGILFGALSAFYHYATPVRLTWQRAVPGAALALVLFLLLSSGLRFYIGRVGTQLLLFSTLAAPVVALLYFYVLAFAVLLGAELNGTLEILHPAGRRLKHRHRWARVAKRVWAALAGKPKAAEESAEEPDTAPAPPSGEADAVAVPAGHLPVGSES